MNSRCPQICVLLALFAAFVSLLLCLQDRGHSVSQSEMRDSIPATTVTRFDAWQSEHISATELVDPRAIEAGVALAKLRGMEMLTLIKSDPRAALARSLSYSEYAALPAQVRAYVERPFSAPAELQALPICAPEPGKLGSSQLIDYRLVLDGQSFAVSAFGRRQSLDTKEGTPLQGIALGGLAAVRDEIFQIVEPGDAEFYPQAQSQPGNCFATGEKLGAAAVVALAGGKQFHFANAEVLAGFDARVAAFDLEPGPYTGSQVIFLLADGDDGFDWPAAEDEVDLQASSWTETPKDVYFIRIDFSDVPGASINEADLDELMNTTVSDTIEEMSYGKTEINGTVSPVVVRMPNPTSAYTSTDNNGLHSDAKAAAEAQVSGLDLDDYDIVGVHFASIGMGSGPLSAYAGLAGGSRQWIQGNSSSNVMIHEFGHNYGIGHASFWETSDGSVVGAGTSDEYGDDFDIMGDGSNSAHPHPQAKQRLAWLEPAQWTDVSSAGSGTFRVYRFDDPGTTGSTRGLRVTKGASPDEYYWLGYRKNLADNQWLQSGAYLVWQRPSNTRSWLLDTTPGSDDGRDDGAILPGRTYSDSAAQLHITTVASGGSAPDEWIDVRVNLGSFSGNSAPTATLNSPATAEARENVTFTVSGSDDDNDELAYFWDFADSTIATNSASQMRSWSVGGSYTISVTVSDMKGGTVTKTQSVTVNDPLENWTQRSSGTTADLLDIATDGTKLVAVGTDDGTYRISSDSGATWSGGTVNNNNLYLRGIVWDGSQFLAAGQDYDFGASAGWRGVIYTSPDGNNWTERYFGGPQLRDIATSGGVHVAVGDDGTIWRSTNGSSWNPIPSGTSTNLRGVSYGSGGFVAVGSAGNGGSGVVLKSTDGSAWNDTSSGASLASWQGFYDVQYCNDRFLASGWYSKIRHSSNGGATFTTTRPITEQIPAFAYGNGVYFAAGEETPDFDVSYIRNLISTDGETWTALSTNATQNLRNSAIFFGDTFITVADGGQIWQSDTFSTPPTGGGEAFSIWLERYFPGSDPATMALIDSDGDGSSNLGEFASGTVPTSPASNILPQLSKLSGYQTLTVTKNPAATDVGYRVEISNRMDGWDTTGTLVITDDANSLVVRSATPIDGAGNTREYLRAVFTLIE
ncbi:MAG: hypothetical protein ACI9UA_000543 [Pseudoalteromonas tetraodonis]|jgi:hypothetical protein